MVAIPVIAILSASAGFIAGTLARQPEINKLKKQLKSLQSANGELRIMMEKQQEQLEFMLIEYQKIKFYHILRKKEKRAMLRGELYINYTYKEYIELLVKNVKSMGEFEMDDNQKNFFGLCNKQISGEKLSIEEESIIRNYIFVKYREEILKLKKCDLIECIDINCA